MNKINVVDCNRLIRQCNKAGFDVMPILEKCVVDK
jgi:hypothetical protein